jgi:hypothetical protein
LKHDPVLANLSVEILDRFRHTTRRGDVDRLRLLTPYSVCVNFSSW